MKDKLIPWRKRFDAESVKGEEHPFELLHREVNDLFDSYFRGTGRLGRHTAGAAGFELSETDHDVRVKVELPGMDEKDIQVSLEENLLTIRGERKNQKETNKRNYHVSEMSYGEYRRSIPLPGEVDAENTKARFKHGVLTLTLPKTGHETGRIQRIPVHED